MKLFFKPTFTKILLTLIIIGIVDYWILYHTDFRNTFDFYFGSSFRSTVPTFNNPCPCPPGDFCALCNITTSPGDQYLFAIKIVGSILLIICLSYILSCGIIKVFSKPQKKKTK